MDQTTRKRIQNRVAQRTYRRRVKQRLDDLQRQVDDHERSRGERQPPNNHGDISSVSGSANDLTNPTSTLSELNLMATGHTIYETNKNSVATAASGQASWAGGPEDHTYIRGHARHGSASSKFQWNGQEFGLLSETPFDLTDVSSESPMQQLPTSNLELSSAAMPLDHLQPSDIGYQPEIIRAPNSSIGPTDHRGLPKTRDLSQGNARENSSCSLPNAERDSSELGAIRYPMASDRFTRTQLPATSPPKTSETVATSGEVSVQTDPLQGPSTSPSSASEESDDVPSIDSTVEEKFEYLLARARTVGFNGFDALASQYYTLNFDHTSSLALEQRTSRNRHLPAILAELRQRSGNWMPWERHGYQAEILKSAEEICATECSEFRKCETTTQVASALEMTLQDKLPNLWALLAGLTSRNTSPRQQNRSRSVFASILLLCGLEDVFSLQSMSLSNSGSDS
ncbi:hypothetical protein BDR22DRAFT_473636 [Usnea florida]